MKKTVLASMVAATTIGFLTPLSSHAFGLGKIDVQSALNEPFKAEIPVAALRPEEKDNLQVRMASDEEFDKAGLYRSMLLNQMQFDIVERGGRDLILVTSKQPIKEPFIDFLISATAGSGLMLREYTVLLDPPEYVMAETRGDRSTTATAAPAEPRPAEQPTTTRYQYAESTSFTGSSYDVKRSDTLWNVALATRPDSSVSVHQMMMALLEANPEAFSNRNVNGLKAGVTLQIPSRSEMTALSQSAARQAFAEQNDAWANRNRPATTTVAQAEPSTTETAAEGTATETSTETQSDTVSEEASVAESELAASEAAAGQLPTGADARLQLVAPEEDVTSEDDASPNVTGNDEIQQLTEQLTLAQETIEAQAQENIDFKSRMDAMEEQLETMRRLISLKDADMARLQAMLEEEDPALAAEAAAALQADSESMPAETETMSELEAGEAPGDTEMAEADMAEDAEAMDESATLATDAETQPEPGQQADTSETAEITEPTAAEQDGLINQAATALNLDPAEVESTIDQVKQFVADNKMPTALGLLLVLLILWLIARRSSREVTWDEAVKKMDKNDSEASDGAPAVVAPATEEQFTDAPLADEQADQEKSVGELVEQADMFVGYADYVQARSSLEQARNLEPANTLVAHKLLFVMYKQDQADEFVELVEQTEFDKDSLKWDEIKQWGQSLVPGHALFAEPAQPDDEPGTEANVEAPAFDSEPAQTGTSDDEQEAASTEAAEDNHLEFDLNDFADTDAQPAAQEEKQTAPEAEAEDDLLAFDTNLTGSDDKDETVDSEAPLELDISENSEADDTLSFDEEVKPVSMDDESDDTDTAEVADSEDAPDLEFDIGDLDEIDEAETKLDLASAYVDMGDPDGARSILNEVLVEGNDEQKNRAHELLNSLS